MWKRGFGLAVVVLCLTALTPLKAVQAGCGYAYCWGAVGFGPNGAWAYSHSYKTERGAWRKADRSCKGDCTVIKTFYNSCGAIAAGPDNGWGWGYGSTKRAAQRTAMSYCKANSYNCSVRAWACSY